MSDNGHASGLQATLVLVRHAHTHMAGRFCGISDPLLSPQGVAQLAGLQQRLAAYPITHVFSSPSQRARQTAEAVAQARGLQVEYYEVLHELAFGKWEGLDWEQVVARDPEYAQQWLDQYPFVPAPGGELFDDFVQRVNHAMNAIAAQVSGGCGAVVTHAGVIRTFLEGVARRQGVAFDASKCDYAGCQELGWNQEQWILPQVSETCNAAASAPAELMDFRG